MAKKNWIAGAIKHPGALRKQAKSMGMISGDERMSNSDLDRMKKMGGKIAKRANLAMTLRKMH